MDRFVFDGTGRYAIVASSGTTIAYPIDTKTGTSWALAGGDWEEIQRRDSSKTETHSDTGSSGIPPLSREE